MTQLMLVLVLYVALSTAGACGGSEHSSSEVAPTAAMDEFNGLILRVGEGRYWIGDHRDPIPFLRLESTLAAYHTNTKGNRIQLRIYPGTSDPSWGKAVNLAAKVGFVKVSRVHDYTDDHSPTARQRWKYYPEEDLTEWRAEMRRQEANPSRDTLPRRQ